MATIKLKRFTRPQILKHIGRELLGRFFANFARDLDSKNIKLPGPELADDEYFQSLAAVLMSPEGLPDGLNEALFALDEMGNAEGRERLERAAAASGVALEFAPDSSHAEIALQAWLAAPGLLARTHNEQRLRRLASFQHARGHLANTGNAPFNAPDQAALAALTAALDSWFAQHHRGQGTTRIEVYPIAGEFWFLVRHGGTYTRKSKIEKQKTEVLHFRPERDDVVVYSPEHDEIRINARTKGERELYCEKFGLFLRGHGDYFSERQTYTLEPLRTEGADALDADGIEGISRITLREIEVAWENGPCEVLIRRADDIFQSTAAGGLPEELIPKGGRLARAGFDFHFADSARPRPVQLRPPNILKIGRHADARAVDRWLSKRGFRLPTAQLSLKP